MTSVGLTPGVYGCALVEAPDKALLSLAHRAWSQAPQCGPFTLMGDSTPPRRKTSVRALHDAEAVYFRFTCEDPDLRGFGCPDIRKTTFAVWFLSRILQTLTHLEIPGSR